MRLRHTRRLMLMITSPFTLMPLLRVDISRALPLVRHF